jgi:hypothetical protein
VQARHRTASGAASAPCGVRAGRVACMRGI